MSTAFPDMHVDRPQIDKLQTTFNQLLETVNSGDRDKIIGTIKEWDNTRRTFSTWSALARLHFTQDTRNESFKKEREYADEISPKFTDLNVKLLKQLLESKNRDVLEQSFGEHAFRLWEADIASFDPAIQDDLVKENKLTSEYTELKTSAEIEFQGETYNLSGIRKFYDVADRETRHAARKATYAWFEEHGAEFDRLYDELVKLRDSMAKKLGFDSYIELGYARLQRTDYTAEDVARFRIEVQEHIVPLAAALFDQQRERLGLDSLKIWDEGVYDDKGNPTPNGNVDELTKAAQDMFNELHPELGAFFDIMVERQLMDLDTRKGKAGGGYCTTLADYGVPFIFANFNGTKHDAEVFTHEIGHAFQCYLSMDKPLYDYVWPTLEACEIHSMSLEFFTWPHMEKFFGDDAERFRQVHLAQSLQFFAYGTAVDHFQHEVYANPQLTPEERRNLWLEMEKTYLPWRDWDDISWGAAGGRWQMQSHIYQTPFYYIDYVLAQTCALQFWDQMQDDFEDALGRYVELCKRGGEAPFQELAKSAGLRSPFETGCLAAAAARAREYLV